MLKQFDVVVLWEITQTVGYKVYADSAGMASEIATRLLKDQAKEDMFHKYQNVRTDVVQITKIEGGAS